jgi:hypothetical protein
MPNLVVQIHKLCQLISITKTTYPSLLVHQPLGLSKEKLKKFRKQKKYHEDHGSRLKNGSLSSGTHQPLPRWENPPLRRLFQFADLCLAANTGRFTKKWGDERPTCLQQVKQRFNVLKAMS